MVRVVLHVNVALMICHGIKPDPIINERSIISNYLSNLVIINDLARAEPRTPISVYVTHGIRRTSMAAQHFRVLAEVERI